ncbi:MAG: DUF1553 domain-containing protein [Planctomycetes bacterium]|nr:DUF1553 domain-containing protein [Planctomycetota bacterium]
MLLWLAAAGMAMAQEGVDFSRDVAPLLERRCLPCHQPGIRKGNLSLHDLSDVKANDLLSPGKPAESVLLKMVLPGPGGRRPKMPKEGDPLKAGEAELLKRWLAAGAPWPEGRVLQERSKADKNWWSLRPLAGVAPPGPAAHPIDRFIQAGLEAKGLKPSPPASRPALIRRVTYGLTGLPPTPAEVEAFVSDPDPDAYEKVVDRLLASPAYGEHWGRHWLDVVRFGESTGFERNIILDSAWPFRDYVIRSFNEDKPFDRLVAEHLAGDVIGGGDPSVEVGTGFLVGGPYDNVGNQDAVQAARIRADTLDDMIRATGESFLGVTIGCARCHNHKFDPITQLDYYRLYASLASVYHGTRTAAGPDLRKERTAREQSLQARREALAAEREKIETEATTRAVEPDWPRPAADPVLTEEVFEPVEAAHLRLVAERCDDAPRERSGWIIDEFEAWTAGDIPRNAALISGGAKGPRTAIDGLPGTRWTAPGPELVVALPGVERIAKVVFSSNRLKDPARKSERFLADYRIEVSLDGKTWRKVADSAGRAPSGPAHRRARLAEIGALPADRERLAAIEAGRAALEKELATIPPLPSWWMGQFRKTDGPFHVFVGGDPQKKGDAADFRSPSFLGGGGTVLDAKAPEGERRLELARWITAPGNPLTPRVLANRLWHYHFGTGIVDTPGDFGYMGSRPTHPELLDWLAARLQEGGWKLKPLHRLIVTSQAYRQSAGFREEAARVDGDSRLLWRFPPRRLSAEELRDTMLTLAGKLPKEERGGPGFRLYKYVEDNVATYLPLDRHGPETWRRAVYHQNARAARVDVLTDFDCPDSAFAAPRRASTTTPLQALTLLNHSFTAEMAGFLAARLRSEAGPDAAAQVSRAFLLAYGRLPSDAERTEGAAFVARQGLKAFARALLNTSELLYLH